VSQPAVTIRPAGPADFEGIIAIAIATGQDEDWEAAFPGYLRHLLGHGTLLVAERAPRGLVGYGGAVQIGPSAKPVSMLTDLFVHPAAHGAGIGRALLGQLWDGRPRRMTFSSLHSHALPLYTSAGLDAWWPLLYMRGDVRRLAMPPGWAIEAAGPDRVGALELAWTGADRSACHRFWATGPRGAGVVARLSGRPAAAGSVGGAGAEYGICHLAVDPAMPPGGEARAGGEAGSGGLAADAVIAVLAGLDAPGGLARACLPAPHPAVRRLLAAGWRVGGFDLHMASEPGLLDPRRIVPSPGLA